MTEEELADLNPGSPLAYGYGCKCPILDNRHGEGYSLGKLWIIARTCPLHGKLKSVLGEETLQRLAAFQQSFSIRPRKEILKCLRLSESHTATINASRTFA